MASKGATRIANERRRQVEVEGYDALDDLGQADALLLAAIAYIRGAPSGVLPPPYWPWSKAAWKLTRIRQLEKAGALVAAAIDVLLEEEARRGE